MNLRKLWQKLIRKKLLTEEEIQLLKEAQIMCQQGGYWLDEIFEFMNRSIPETNKRERIKSELIEILKEVRRNVDHQDD